MSELLKQARTALRLSAPRLPSSDTADRWLIGLRWGATAGMTATILVARVLVPALQLAPLLAVLGGIVLLNVGWILAARRATAANRSALVAAQVYVDVLALAAILWFSGGVENPFAAFLVFQIVLAGLLGTGRTSVGVTLLTMVAIAALFLAPPLPLDDAPLGRDRVLWIGHGVALATLSAFLGAFVLVYVQRIEQLRTEGGRNEKLAMLGRLVGGMSHELNTPLATILLASRDLVEVGKETGSPDVAQLSGTIAEEAQRASDVIGLLRGHVRPDQHREPLELTAFVTDLTTRELNRLGFRGERVIEAPAPAQLPVLKAGLTQILKNVLTNAVEAGSARIAVAVHATGDGVTIAVRDNGPGIDADLLPRIGEPFQTTKAEQGGMGLGLYVSTVLAEQMDGTLHVECDAAGTRVTLSLPPPRAPL